MAFHLRPDVAQPAINDSRIIVGFSRGLVYLTVKFHKYEKRGKYKELEIEAKVWKRNDSIQTFHSARRCVWSKNTSVLIFQHLNI